MLQMIVVIIIFIIYLVVNTYSNFEYLIKCQMPTLYHTPTPQCITRQFWKTEVAVLSDQVRLVACRNFDIFGWLSVIYSLKVDQPNNKNKTNAAKVCHLYFWLNNSALFEHWNWQSQFKHRWMVCFRSKKGVKNLIFLHELFKLC